MNSISDDAKYFLITLCVILVFGVIMVYSSSYIYAQEVLGSSVYFFVKQLFFILLGISIWFFFAKTKFEFWYKHSEKILIGITLLLALTCLPGISVKLKGASRWLDLQLFMLHPGELLKVALIVYILKYFNLFNRYDIKSRVIGAFLVLIPLVLLLFQPDFGTFLICFMIISYGCFLSDFPKKPFIIGFLLGAVALVTLVLIKPYRLQRVLVFLDPWKDPQSSGFQIIQSFLAFANGSFWGQGIGNSNEKLFYLPEAHNDFIFSVIGEEVGFVGVCLVVFAYLLLIYLGYKMALKAKTRITMLFISIATFSIGLQSFINMGVVLGLLPTKGLNLPFISTGGSSMLANFWLVGLVFSALKYDLKWSDSSSVRESLLKDQETINV